jgi:hypothetical protein
MHSRDLRQYVVMADRWRPHGGWAVQIVHLEGAPDHRDGTWIRVTQYGSWVADVRSVAELKRYFPLASMETLGLASHAAIDRVPGSAGQPGGLGGAEQIVEHRLITSCSAVLITHVRRNLTAARGFPPFRQASYVGAHAPALRAPPQWRQSHIPRLARVRTSYCP